MKILHVLDHSIPIHSGYTFRTRAILEQQRIRGWETAHLTSAKHELGIADAGWIAERETDNVTRSELRPLEEDVDGFHFYRSSPPNGLSRRFPAMHQFATVYGLSRRLDEVTNHEMPDVLHAHSPALNGIATLRVGTKRHLPVVYEVRALWEDAAVNHGTCREGGLRYRLVRAMETYIHRRAAVVTTICEGLKRDIVARGIPEQRVFVVPNAVDTSAFSTGQAADQRLRQKLGLNGKVVVAYIGSFYAYEGVPLLLRALPAILNHDQDVRLLLVGGGPQENELKALAQSLKIADKVVFAGRVPHGDVQRYYTLVDVLVYPRLPMRLTNLVTPLKPLEAMAMGKLVAASDVGGHRELIRDGVTGVLFDAGRIDSLVAKLLLLLEQRQGWPVLQAAARQFVEEQRTWEKSVACYENVYALAVGANSHP